MPADRAALATLVEEKTRWIVPREGRWHVYFLGFSRSGWTESAMQYAQELNNQALWGENWTCSGYRC